MGGDFNVILELSEKSGGIRNVSQPILGFRTFVVKCGLLDCPTKNGTFMWTNRRKDFTSIVEILDRFLIPPS